MKTLYESIFDEETNMDNIDVESNKYKIIKWFMDHDLDNMPYKFWKLLIKFKPNQHIVIDSHSSEFIDYCRKNPKKNGKIVLNFDKEIPNYIKIDAFDGRILIDVTKAKKLDLSWFAAHISQNSVIELVCEDTEELIIPENIVFNNGYWGIKLEIFSDKLHTVKFNCKELASKIGLFCSKLENIDIKHTPKCESFSVPDLLIPRLRIIYKNANSFNIYPISFPSLKPKY
jgi:hypothetical protein